VRSLALLALLPSAALAQTEPQAPRLTVTREPEAELCADQSALSERVENILHRPFSALAKQALIIDVKFERGPDGAFISHVVSHGVKPGERKLRDKSPTCGPLSEATAVAVALLVDTALADSAPVAETTPPKAPPPKTTPPPSKDEQAAAGSAMAPGHLHGRFALELGASYGLAALAAPAGAAHLSFGYRGWLLDLSGQAGLGSEHDFGGGRVTTSLVLGAARLCYELGRRATIAPCAALAVGRLRGVGSGYDPALDSNLLWLAAGLGLSGTVPVGGPWFLAADATWWVPTRRQSFSVQNAGIAWESKPVAGALLVGVGATLF
jgi:hypothetical protein